MHPKISIIVPCYNLGSYLDGCLESIAAQDSDNVEYIFINDGSSDDTLQKLQFFCGNHEKYKLINQVNSGVSSARNAALKIARGEYVYLLDGDDRLTKDAVKRMIKYLNEYEPDILISDTKYIYSSRELIVKSGLSPGIYTPEQIFECINTFPTPPQKIYRRSILTANNISFNKDLKLGEVYDFTVRVLSFSKKILVVSDVFFYYMMRGSSATHKPNYQNDLTVLRTLQEYENNGKRFKKYGSFSATALKMVLSFTYNKYVRSGLHEKETVNAVDTVLNDPTFKEYLKSTLRYKRLPLKERMLYSYIAHTGVNGYKILSSLLKVTK